MLFLLICIVFLDHRVSHVTHLIKHIVCNAINIELCCCSLEVHYVCNNMILFIVFVRFNVEAMKVCICFECVLINISYLTVYISVTECTGGFDDLICVALCGSIARPVLNSILFLILLNVSEH